MNDNDWLFDEEQAARIRRLVTPDETGSQDVPGPTTVLRLLDALNAAEARAAASERKVERLREIADAAREYRRREGDWAQAVVEMHDDEDAVLRARIAVGDRLDALLAALPTAGTPEARTP